MVYMAGDNNLSEDMIRAIIEMSNRIKDTGDTRFPQGSIKENQVNFRIEFDGSHPYVPTRRYNLTYSTKATYPSTRGPDEVSDSAASMPIGANPLSDALKAFIEDAVTQYPARNYALILSGHSDAFLGRALLLDESPSGVMTLKEISDVLEALKKANKFPNGKMDILGFDGCVMNTLEVLYEFQDVAYTCVGSQGTIPNFTWDYGDIAKSLMQESADALTKDKIIETFSQSIKKYNREFAFGGRSVDFSAIELQPLDDAVEKANRLALALIVMFIYHGKRADGSVGPEGYVVSRLLDVLLKAHWNCQTSLFNQMVDAKDFCKRLITECEKLQKDLPTVPLSHEKVDLKVALDVIKLFAKRFEDSIDSRVVSRGVYTGADCQFANGLSFFYPWSFLGFAMSRNKYEALKFTDKSWLMFLFLFCTSVLTARPSQSFQLEPTVDGRTSKAIASLCSGIITKLKVAEKKIGMKPKIALSVSIWEQIFDKVPLISLTLSQVVGWVELQPQLNPPNSKLNPPNSKGLDLYYEYFGRTNNIFPKLNIEGDFPPNNYSPTEVKNEVQDKV